MNYLVNEIRGLIHNRKIIISFLVLLFLNIVFLLVYIDTDSVDSGEYLRLKNKMLDDSSSIETEYYENSESEAAAYLYNESLLADTYKEYNNKVMSEAENNQNVSIFKTEFSQNNLKKTKADYERLKDIEIIFVGGYGLSLVLNFSGSLIITTLFMILISIETILRDKKNGLLNLYKTTKNGDGRLIIAKYAASFAVACAFYLLVYISDISVALVKYGSIDMSAAVQSISDYMTFGMDISIGGFVCLNFIFKILLFASLLSVIIFIMLISANEVVGMVLMAVTALIVQTVSSLGVGTGAAGFRHFSIKRIFAADRYFAYLNYNIFNKPVNAVAFDSVLLAAVILIMVLASAAAFGAVSCDYTESMIYGAIKGIRQSKRKKRRAVTSVLRLENYKLMFGYKLVFVLLLLIALQAYTYKNKETHWGLSDYSYKYYMEMIEGEITDEKLQYISDEEERYEKLNNELQELDRLFNAGEIPQNTYDSRVEELIDELKGETGFERCKKYVDYIVSCDDDNLGFVYDRGWNMLTGVSAKGDDLLNAIKLSVVMIPVFAFLFFEDYKYKINGILDTTMNKKRLGRIKWAYTLLILIFSYMVIYLPQIIWVNDKIGLSHSEYSIRSLMYKSNTAASVSILGYIIIVSLTRIVGELAVLIVLYALGRWLKSTGAVILVAMLGIVLPMLLAYIGVSGFDGYIVTKVLTQGRI